MTYYQSCVHDAINARSKWVKNGFCPLEFNRWLISIKHLKGYNFKIR